MPQAVVLKNKGLHTFTNHISELPEGALLEATNIVVDRDSIIQPRRGFKIYGNAMGVSPTSDIAKQLLVYKGRVLRHYSSTLQYDSDGAGTFVSFLQSVEEVQSGLRIKSQEANRNLYFTTSEGIKKISAVNAAGLASASITSAGGVKALDTQVVLANNPGWFLQDSVVAYRILWGIKDANENLILGTPSERVVIYNPITDLLIQDFNNLLSLLDQVNNPGGISDQNYVTTLKVPLNSDAATLRTNLIALASKLDNDTIITESTIDVASSQRLTSTTLQLVFSSSVATFLQTGDRLHLTGFSNTDVNDKDVNITSVSGVTVGASLVSGTYSATDGAPIAETGASTVQRLKYTLISQPVALSDNPTTAQLESMQTYYDAIVTDLQLELSGIVTNPTIFDSSNSTQSSTTNVTFTVPAGVTTSHFYQIYRTAMTTSSGTTYLFDLDPGDEEGLVYESNPTSGEISAKSVTVEDIVPESFRGANLYTNPNSGEGILQANDVPPLATDISSFKNYTFYANTQTVYRKTLNLLSVSQLVSGVSTLTITDGTTSNTYTFVSPVAEVSQITTNGAATLSGGEYFILYSGQDLKKYVPWYKVGGVGTAPVVANSIPVEIDVGGADSADQVAAATKAALNALSDFTVSVALNVVNITCTTEGISTNIADFDTGFAFTTLTQGKGEDATNKKVLLSNLPTPAQQVDETTRSLLRVINKQSGELVNGYYLSGPDDVPGNFLLESRSLGASAFYLNVDSTTTGSQFSPSIPTSGNSNISDNEVAPNRLYYSKLQQPEAVPILNYLEIGPRDKAILRILPLRDSLFILKEDAIYRLSGETAPFNVALFDSSALLIAADSAVVLNNLIYMISDQGVITLSDTGVSVISRPIEDQLRNLNSLNYPNFPTATFGLAYETDRAYLMWTVKATTDINATQCFRYNTFTNTWSILDLTKTCAVVNPTSKKIYLGAADTNYIEVERKDFARTDYADREYDFTLGPGDVTNGTTIELSTVTNTLVGDALYQKQYLTIRQFNRLLEKLDNDPTLTDTNYLSSLEAFAGDTMSQKLTDLVAKLNADPSTTSVYTSSGSNVFTVLQTDFNLIITTLNSDPGVGFKNYTQSSGFVEYETTVMSRDTTFNKITVEYTLPWIAGPIKTFRAIESKFTWGPQFFGDPSVFKQSREATILFEQNNFTNATLSYSSDLNPSIQEIPFPEAGPGLWGNFEWGATTWGGDGTGQPLRTLIPATVQRCRYINCGFKHKVAREYYSIYGYSMTYEAYSTRAYK